MSSTKQQPTLFSFFKKTPNGNSNLKDSKDQKSPLSDSKNVKSEDQTSKKFLGCESIKLKGTDIKVLDLVWAKLEGYPWWPAIVYEHPTKKIVYSKKQIHVQFFDDPPTRGWVKESFVKAYGPPASCGIPSYKDPEWITAKEEADQVISVPLEDRRALIVRHSEEDISSDGVSYLEDSETSKENIDLNGSTDRKRTINGDAKDAPKTKKRRIVIVSDEESDEEEYKPDKEESDDDSGSSGVDESKVSDIDPETESECGTPVKREVKKRKLPSNGFGSSKPKRNISFTPKGTPNRPPASIHSPSVSESTKSKLSSFAAKEVKTPSKTKDEGDWPHTKLQWLQPEHIRDEKKRLRDDPEYDCRTLYVPDDFMNKQTPAMRQWWELKSRHFDTILFFKMGKFYELFHMDAILSIQELGLLMMKGDYAHTGFPEIAFGRYSSVLVEKGYKVGRIEQVETPDMMEKRCKNLCRPTKFDKVVKRELCQVTSLGTKIPSVFDGETAESSQSFLLAVTERVKDGPGEMRQFGVCFIDTSVGVFNIGQFEDDRHLSRLRTLIAHHPPAQILLERGRVSANTLQLMKAVVPCGLLETLAPEKEFWLSSKTLTVLAESPFFKKDSVMTWPVCLKQMIEEDDPLGLTAKECYDLAVRSLGGVIWYLSMCKLEDDLLSRKKFELFVPPDQLEQLSDTSPDSAFRRHMIVDGTSLRNLEIFENSSDGSVEGSLYQTVNHCSTAFGKRLLHYWLCSPLCNKADIDSRLDAIEDLRENPQVTAEVKELTKKLPDLERLLAKIHSIGLNRSPDHPDKKAIFFEMQQYSKRKVADFLAAVNGFKTTVLIINAFKGIKEQLKSSLLKSCVSLKEHGGKFHPLDKVLHFFDNAFDHSLAKKEGKIIPSSGVDKEYDEAVDKINETKQALDEYLKEQCRYFSAKVTYWGTDKKRFQLEVPDHATKRAGDTYELTSQRKGFKRYWTEETKEMLADMMSAEERRESALQDIATRIFNQFDEYQKEWNAAVECIAVLDVLLSLTEFSLQGDTTRPHVRNPSEGEKPFIRIIDGRHPCAIKIWSGGEYIPNNVVVGCSPDDEETHSQLVLVTGPNMGGKSTLMRQTALICLLAQMGSFVPATECSLSPVDRIFTRLGAWDRIYQGESTFYVEMAETASIIQHATTHSLVIVDELGRGTATYDGTAIAHSVVNSLVQIGCRTLFSTHYHSLVDEFNGTIGVSLGHMACMVESENDEDPSQETITFLYKFTKGACPKSYGFNAARLADLPESVIQSASGKAKELEKFNNRKKAFKRLFSELFLKGNCLKDLIKDVQHAI